MGHSEGPGGTEYMTRARSPRIHWHFLELGLRDRKPGLLVTQNIEEKIGPVSEIVLATVSLSPGATNPPTYGLSWG